MNKKKRFYETKVGFKLFQTGIIFLSTMVLFGGTFLANTFFPLDTEIIEGEYEVDIPPIEEIVPVQEEPKFEGTKL